MEIFIGIAAVLGLAVAIICIGYVKSPPDTAYIISGFRKPRILIGRAGMDSRSAVRQRLVDGT